MSQSSIDRPENHENNGKSNIVLNLDSPNLPIDDDIPEENKKGNGLILGILLGIIGTMIGMRIVSGNPATENVATPSPMVIENTNTKQTITTTQARIRQIDRKIQATGTVSPYELIPVMSQSSNLQIKEVLVDEGDIVTQGQVLIRLDDTILQAELKQAQAGVNQAQARLTEVKAGTRQEELQRARENVNFAQADVLQAESDLQLAQTRLERNKELEAQGAIPRDRLDELINDESTKKFNVTKNKARLREAKERLAELQKGERPEVIAQAVANLEEAQTRVRLVQARLKDTVITSPADGKIAQRNARVGDVTSSFNLDRQLFTIIEQGRLELQVRVPENQLKEVTSGQRVLINSSANPDMQITGIVREINPVIDEQSRQGIVRIDLPKDTNLKTGMFVQTSIITNTKPLLTVPMTAVLPQRDSSGIVYIVNADNTVKAQTVTLGEIIDNQDIVILSGLNAGDMIALQGVNYLQDGGEVIVQK
ncbi:efflux RND transporter periplasmic adaptor subunit [Geminocystis sp. CENA526]|uniref:efflux RND transporter periplasmic adaptor subunit n=1 Tax=Geminocystis sp. CENA526 TaxID=1355871 RepID=UPI003D6E30B8